MSFKRQLIEMEACQEAIDWVEDRTIQQAWNDCHRGDWMLWLLEEMKGKEGWPDEKETMLLGCWCARRILKYIPKEETRPLKAIEAKEKWARGEITREEMNTVNEAAWDVAKDVAWSVANDATWAAARIAASGTPWVAAKIAARAAASNAVNNAACDGVWDATLNKELSIQADYIRTQFTPSV